MRAPPPRSPRFVAPDPSIAAPDDVAAFADLPIDDPGRALRLLIEMPAPVRVAQALAYAGWPHSFNLPALVQAILAGWAACEQRTRS